MNMQGQRLLPLLYFPTTALFIDDNPLFLSAIRLKIDKKTPILLYDDPEKALDLLCKKTSRLDILIRNEVERLYAEEEACNLPANISTVLKLYLEIYNKYRFAEISTIVIDYSMPYLDGVALCREIKQLPIKKIMLTATAEHQKAVQLFNEGLIDYFIRKDSLDLHLELNNAIQKAQWDYFENVSQPLLDYLRARKQFSYLQEVQSISHTNRSFSEYYLLDSSGSTLFIDFDGKPTWFISKPSQELESYYDIALYQDADDAILKGLQNKNVVPFFFTEEDQQMPVNQWGGYLHEAISFPVFNGYYAVINGHVNYQLDEHKVFSYKEHLQEKQLV